VLTGINSTYTETSLGTIAIMVHVTGGDPGLNGIIYDLEIKFGEQDPPWESGGVLGVEPPYDETWAA